MKKKTTTIIIFVFRLLPLGLRKRFFRALLGLYYHIDSRHRIVTLHNLVRSFPEKPLPEMIRIAKNAYRHIGTIAAEFFELPYLTRDNLADYLEIEGLEYMEQALTQKKGVLSIVAHFGNWEMMAAAMPIAFKPLHVIYRPLDNPVLEDLVYWVRTLHGNVMLPREGSVIRTYRLLARNNIMGILVDQNVATREGIFVDFFNRPACTAVGLAVLAQNTGAPVLPAFMIRMPDGRYKLQFQPAVEWTETGDPDRDILVNTQRYTQVVENVVRQYPDQYFWLHHRWKTQPCQQEGS